MWHDVLYYCIFTIKKKKVQLVQVAITAAVCAHGVQGIYDECVIKVETYNIFVVLSHNAGR